MHAFSSSPGRSPDREHTRARAHACAHATDGRTHLLQQLVGPVRGAVARVAHHEVGELVDVAGRLEDGVRGQVGALDLEHVLLEHEVLAPVLQEVGLERARGRAEVVPVGVVVVVF